MDTEEKKKLSATLVSMTLLCIQVFMYVWSVVFIRYGDHVKYDPDIIITIQLGIGIACFFLNMMFIIYISMTNYAEYVSDKKVEEQNKRLRELEAELERQKRRG